MGGGYSFHCNNCGKDYDAWIGAGMLYPSVCKETLEAVRQGEYGPELQEAAESEEYVGVSAEEKIYVCEDCGFWSVHKNVVVYGLADKEAGPNSKFGERTIAEWGFIPYVTTSWAGQEGFRIIKEPKHLCEKCNGEMHALDIDEDSDDTPNLKCNNCGSELSQGNMRVLWD